LFASLFAWSSLLGLWACGTDPLLASGGGGGGGDSAVAQDSAKDGAASSDSGGAKDSTVGSDSGGVQDSGVADSAPATETLRFLAVGDTGTGAQAQKDVAKAMEDKCKLSGCDFALLLGDNMYESGVSSATDPLFKTQFEDVYKNLNFPFYVVLGNHDYGSSGAGFDKTKAHYEVLYASTRWKLPSEYWHRVEKHAEFFGLDTTAQMWGQADTQATTVKGWISASKATWKIGVGHHPYISNGPHGNAGTYEGIPFVPVLSGTGVKSFFDDNICGKVDIYFSGHDHSRQWPADKCGKTTELIVSGDGAKATDLTGKNKMNFQSNSLGFVYVVIEGKKLTLDFIDKQGKVEFTKSISK
jgi:hypothetical protein